MVFQDLRAGSISLDLEKNCGKLTCFPENTQGDLDVSSMDLDLVVSHCRFVKRQ